MRTALGVILAVVIAGTASIYAQPGMGGGMGMGPGPMHGRMDPDKGVMGELKLTDAQKTDMQRLRSAMEKSMIEIQSKIKLSQVDLKTLLTAEAPDREAIKGKIKDISDQQYKAKMLRVDHLFDVRKLLTPEQQKIWKEHMMQRSMDGMGPMMEGRGKCCEGMRRGAGPG